MPSFLTRIFLLLRICSRSISERPGAFAVDGLFSAACELLVSVGELLTAAGCRLLAFTGKLLANAVIKRGKLLLDSIVPAN